MVWLMAYSSTGAFVGFLAGLLGIGGGMTLVPILATLFAAQGLAPEHTVHLALGTGMASIAFTSGSSVREHHRHTAVDWKVVARMVPGMLLGTLLSTVAAGWIGAERPDRLPEALGRNHNGPPCHRRGSSA